MKRQRGFTLVEILVAVAISAVLAAMAFTAMQEAMANRERVRVAQARLVALQFTIRSLVQDFSQLAARPVRVPVGEGYEAALQVRQGDSTQVSLTRAGWGNPSGSQRSALQRVHYELRNGVLYRDFWTVLDAQPDLQPVQRALLEGVEGFTIRFMNDGRQWQQDWPPQQQQAGEAGSDLRYLRWRPVAVEVTLRLTDWGTITRLIEVAG